MKSNQSKSDRGTGKAHMLLFLYWLHRVLNGANILKTTISVMLMEQRSVSRLRQKDQNEPEETSKRSPRSAKGSAGLIFGGSKGKILGSALKKTAKKQKII